MGVDISDGDLVRLARDGDPAAFRLLVERHQPMARARASRLCSDPHDAEDIVQESFLQAFVALDRLRDPDRFAGWLGGIVLNVHRTQRRLAPLMLLAEWPERLHPVWAGGLPSADDLDRADALRQAVADLPAGQRRAVEMFYYADLPAGQIGDSAGAAKSSLHKARRRLREYITVHRPDLIPTVSRRTLMTTVRIAHAEPRPGKLPGGRFAIDHVLVVLADDAGHRALPIWLPGPDGHSLWLLLDPPARDAEMAGVPEELTDRLLRAAGVTVTGVDIDELGPDVTATRIGLASPTGTQQVTARLADGLAIAVTAGAPVRVAGAVMDRLAVPVQGEDLLGPFLDRNPAAARPSRRWRHEPRNLAFTDGLDSWLFGGSFQRHTSESHWQDYSCTVEDRSAILRSAVPEPCGSAFLGQVIFADDYRGHTVSFLGEFRTEDISERAELFMQVTDEGQPEGAIRDDRDDRDGRRITVADSHGWTRHEVTAAVPEGAHVVRFGITLTGRGRVELRNAELIRGT